MSRMLDRMYAHGMVHVTDAYPKGQHRTVADLVDSDTNRPAFADATVFVIDNVTEYLFAENDQEEWTFEHDFPCVMLPFPTVWLETRRPSRIVSTAYPARSPTHLPMSWGVLLMAEPFRQATIADRAAMLRHVTNMLDPLRPLLETLNTRAKQLGRQLTLDDVHDADERIAITVAQQYMQVHAMTDEAFAALATHDNVARLGLKGREPRWVVQGLVFLERTKGRVLGPVMHLSFYVDGMGKVIPTVAPDGNTRALAFSTYMPMGLDDQRALFDTMSAWLFPVWLALSFCHCTNVDVVSHTPMQRGKRQRYHGHPCVTYHTLNIQPMRKVLQTEGQSQASGLKRSLSICRGHFKDFAQGKGLFGKLHGLYWWEQHLRGSAQGGIVVNDYAVQAPQAAETP